MRMWKLTKEKDEQGGIKHPWLAFLLGDVDYTCTYTVVKVTVLLNN